MLTELQTKCKILWHTKASWLLIKQLLSICFNKACSVLVQTDIHFKMNHLASIVLTVERFTMCLCR